MLGVLFVLLELGGTFASILAQRTVLKSISPEEAYKDSVTNKLFSSSIALKERNTRLKATKIVADIQQNKTMTEVIRYESEAMAQNHRLQEEARLAEIDRENAKLLTEAKLQELEANQLLMMTKGIAKKMEGLDTVRVQIGRILEKGGKNV
jgi:esterase/lipase